MRTLVRRLSSEGITVLLSSHLLTEVEQVCSHAVVMDHGRLVAAGTVADLMRSAAGSAYLEVDDRDAATRVLGSLPGVRGVRPEPAGLTVDLDGTDRAQLVAALVGAGIAVQTVMARHRLEDAFLELLEGQR